jgi:predicted HAD superfamily Cof-like phosphohydrolase
VTYSDQALKIAYHGTPVREFHEVFDHPVKYEVQKDPDPKLRELRVRMLAEELAELARASGVDVQVDSREPEGQDVLVRSNGGAFDVVEAADALADIRYLTDGANLVFGFPGDAVLRIVHDSNMSKLGEDGKPVRRDDGKILKGPNYWKPQEKIAKLLGVKT